MNQLFIETEKVQDPREGKLQVISNIDTCVKISEIMESTLGPYGRDKLFAGSGLLITNDGATILKKLNIVHPVGKLLVKISESQDSEVGDGTTSVVILTAAILNSLKQLIKEDFSLDDIYDVLNEIKCFLIKNLDRFKITYSKETLQSIAETCIISKNIRNVKEHFAKLLVDSFNIIGKEDVHNIGIKKIMGGSISDSKMVNGIAFEKCFTYAGYEQQPKKILDPSIICLNVELEWKAERDNAELKITSVEEYKKVVNAEWNIITDKLDKIIESGANIVLSSLPIGDYATQYFAKKGVFCAGRVPKDDLKRVSTAFNCNILSSTDYLEGATGRCALFEERQLGKERYNYFEGESKNVCTILIRGPGEEILNEVERALNDALNVLKTTIKHETVVTGGGSVEMGLSHLLKEKSKDYTDKKLFICKSVAKAFEKIPVVLATNFGLDPISILAELRMMHSRDSIHSAVTIKGVEDALKMSILEPLQVKSNLIKTAFDAAATIIMIDSTIVMNKMQ